ncbi:hypothetical protein KQX54_015569 [Cotesia glomerata]|uniref:Uncharacterized protein n=1 Tax=Cotesia glomerata TaxID=32391 RepID=A0AAV7HDM3_COTGL|nr:hypothetical protein KQX54_015569 [Cotesia glomerata]
MECVSGAPNDSQSPLMLTKTGAGGVHTDVLASSSPSRVSYHSSRARVNTTATSQFVVALRMRCWFHRSRSRFLRGMSRAHCFPNTQMTINVLHYEKDPARRFQWRSDVCFEYRYWVGLLSSPPTCKPPTTLSPLPKVPEHYSMFM